MNKYRLSLFIIILLIMNSCSEPVTTEYESISPNKEYTATLIVKNYNAIASPSVKVRLRGHFYDSQGPTEREIYSGEGGWPNKIYWASNQTLVIVSCLPVKAEITPVIAKAEKSGVEPWDNRIYVKFISSFDTEIPQASECKP